MSVTTRWANTKSWYNENESDLTRLYEYFRDECPNNDNHEQNNIIISLINFIDTTIEKSHLQETPNLSNDADGCINTERNIQGCFSS